MECIYNFTKWYCEKQQEPNDLQKKNSTDFFLWKSRVVTVGIRAPSLDPEDH
jgi:hypothetical protein